MNCGGVPFPVIATGVGADHLSDQYGGAEHERDRCDGADDPR
jgi:hypothetical protein